MNQRLVCMIIAVFVLLPLRPIAAEDRAGESPTGQIKLANTSAGKVEAKPPGDRLKPKLPQILTDKRLEGYLDPVKRILKPLPMILA